MFRENLLRFMLFGATKLENYHVNGGDSWRFYQREPIPFTKWLETSDAGATEQCFSIWTPLTFWLVSKEKLFRQSRILIKWANKSTIVMFLWHGCVVQLCHSHFTSPGNRKIPQILRYPQSCFYRRKIKLHT